MNRRLLTNLLLILGISLIVLGILYYYKTISNKFIIVWPISKPSIIDVRVDNNIRYYPGVYETLFSYDEFMQLEPGLAFSWKKETIDDISKWIFNIKSSQYFSDGSLLIDDDIVSSLSNIKNTKCLSIDLVLECSTSLDNTVFTRAITTTPIVHIDVLGGILGTGDYYIQSEDDKTILLHKNESYSGTFLSPEIVSVNFIPFPSEIENFINDNEVSIVYEALNLNFQNKKYEKVTFNSLENFFMVPKFAMTNSLYLKSNNLTNLRNKFIELIKTRNVADSLKLNYRIFPSYLLNNQVVEKVIPKDINILDNIVIKSIVGLEQIALFFKSNLPDQSVFILSMTKNEAEKELSQKVYNDELLLLAWNFETADVFAYLDGIVLPICKTYPVATLSKECTNMVSEVLENREIYKGAKISDLLKKIEIFLLDNKFIIPLFETNKFIIKRKNIDYKQNPLGDIFISNIKYRIF